MTKQICIFPYAPHSTPNYNSHAYPVEIDNPNGRGTHWVVWSPVHIPHFIGRFSTIGAAQDLACTINSKGALIYGQWPPSNFTESSSLVAGEGAPQWSFIDQPDEIKIQQETQLSLL